MSALKRNPDLLKSLLRTDREANWELALRILSQDPNPASFHSILDHHPRKMSLCFQFGLISLLKKMAPAILEVKDHPLEDLLRFNQLPSLEELYLRNNQLDKMEAPLELPRLKILRIYDNPIKEISAPIFQHESLEHFALNNSLLEQIPTPGQKPTNIQQLSIRKGRLKYLSDHISTFPYLNTLELAENQIETLSPAIQNLKQLRQLYLGRNQLVQLPKALERLENLEVLDLSQNQFRHFPKEICYLKKLKVLHLSTNFIKRLPEEIQQLRHLELLSLESNPIPEKTRTCLADLLPDCRFIF